MQHSFALDGFLPADGMLFPIAFPFVPPAAHILPHQEKNGKNPILKPELKK